MTSQIALYRRLARTFAKHARYHAERWGENAEDFEGWMWEVTFAKAAHVIHACGPLLEQTNAYIATWAARYAVKRVKRQWRAECLDESLAYTPEPKSDAFADYLERMGEEWGIDVSIAIMAARSGAVSPEFEQYIRRLGHQDRRVAMLLLSGKQRYHIYKPESGERIAGQVRTQRIYNELINSLKKAA